MQGGTRNVVKKYIPANMYILDIKGSVSPNFWVLFWHVWIDLGRIRTSDCFTFFLLSL
jgi:hypothetical protein